MNTLKKTITGALAGILLAVSLAPVAFAESNLSEGAQNVINERCQLVQTKIDTRITNYTEKKAQFESNYAEAQSTLDEIITYLEGEGYDVANLKTAKTEIMSKIEKFKTDYADLITKLQTAKDNFAKCGDGTGTFATYYEDAREQLITVRDDRRDVREYFKSHIRSELKDIKRSKVIDSNE
jgi:hypothetical protein